MSFLAPGWIAIAAFASLAVAAIHLIAWRLPRTMVLPTARFVPDEPARRAARTVRPAHVALLALRIAILMAGGLALARPVFESPPSGSAMVIAAERVSDTIALRAILRGIQRSPQVSFVLFDTSARTFAGETEAMNSLETETAPTRVSLTVGLIAAIREARRLEQDYDSVRIVLASSFALGSFDAATRAVRATWQDSINLVRLPPAAPLPVPATVQITDSGDDPLIAAVRLAQANGLLRGESRLRRTRPTSGDSEWADSGRVLVIWPRAEETDSQRVGGVHADGYTAIGHFVPLGTPWGLTPFGDEQTPRRAPAADSGWVIARWVNGAPAAWEIPHNAGCVRTIGFDVPGAGDFVLTPSFQRVLSILLAPCGGMYRSDVAADSVIVALTAPQPEAISGEAHGATGSDRLAAMLMAVALLLALLELGARRHSAFVRPLERRA